LARRFGSDERQGDLFGGTPAPSLAFRKPRKGSTKPREVAPEPRPTEQPNRQLTRLDLEEVVHGLEEDDLGYLALLVTRRLKRQVARSQSRAGPGRGASGRLSPAERSLRALADELRAFDDHDEVWD
jgi:hypothetical protein